MALSKAHAARRQKYLGASEVPAILGINPYKNAADIYYEKTGEIDAWQGNAATEAGNLIEDALIRWASEKLDVRVRRNQWRVHENKIHAATLDAQILDRAEAIECKTSGLFNPAFNGSDWGEDGTDEVPEHVLVQAQAQMLAAGLERVYVPALLGGGRGLCLFKVERHHDLVQIVLEEGERFWREHVEKLVPPPDVIPSIEVLKRIRREPESTVDVPDELVAQYLMANATAKDAKAAEEAAKARLIEALDTAEAGQSNLALITYLEQTRANVDTKRLKAEHPDIYEAYTTTSSYRVLRANLVKAEGKAA